MENLLAISRNAAVFIAVIALLRQCFRRYLPRTTFVALWLAAAVRMLYPFRLPSAVSIWRFFRNPLAAAGALPTRYWLSPSAQIPARDALPNVFDFLEKVWLFGAGLLLFGIFALYRNGLREARAAEPLGNGAYVCRKLQSPQLCGIVRPRILLPEGVGEELLPYILLHEQVHMRRLDNLWKLLALLAAAIHWFNPAAWVLVALLGRDLEVSCDEWVLRKLSGEQRRSYALALIAMAEGSKGRSPIVCGFVKNPLEERIRMIMMNRKKSALALCAATAVIVCTTSAFATDAPVQAEAALPLAVDAALNGSGAGADADQAYVVTISGEEPDSAVVTVKRGADVYTAAAELEFYTADEYAAYLEEQKVSLRTEIAAGALSQETYDRTIREMEEVLVGIRDGSLAAAKPFTGEDGSAVEIVICTVNASEAGNSEIHYEVDDGGLRYVDIDGQKGSIALEDSAE